VVKRLIFVFSNLFFFFCFTQLHAQPGLGVMAGVNVANIEFDQNDADIFSIPAFGVGAVLDIGLAPAIGLRLEPMYLQKGAQEEDFDIDYGDIVVKYKLNYIEVPLFLKIGAGGVYLMGGPTIGFLLDAKVAGDYGDVAVSVDIKEIVKSTDAGLGFGAGINIPLGLTSLFIEARYMIGLTNIIKEGSINIDGDEVAIQGVAKNRGIHLMAGLMLPLGG
jgi:hypothetical protein